MIDVLGGSRLKVEVDADISLAISACRISLARESYLHFIDHMMRSQGREFLIGRHTRECCAVIDRGLSDLFEHGESGYYEVSIPYRHGKSDLFSRFLFPYVVGKYGSTSSKNPSGLPIEYMLATYAASLSQGFSSFSRRLVRTSAYQEVFPRVKLNPESRSLGHWEMLRVTNPLLSGSKSVSDDSVLAGSSESLGLEGGAAGKGATILVCDDLIKNRKEADSEVVRESAWNLFSDDLMSRLAPVHLVFVVGTRRHVDDVTGRLLNRNNSEHESYSEDFPEFHRVTYRAREEVVVGSGVVEYAYLFPERFPESWYLGQFAQLDPYSVAALLQNDPVLKGGNLLPITAIRQMSAIPESWESGSLPCRAWDLASSKKELNKRDPDWTVGLRGFVRFQSTAHPRMSESELRGHSQLVVTDGRAVKHEATRRNALILETAKYDGAICWQCVEGQGGYKDTATTLQAILSGMSVVHTVTVSRDKYSRISELHPLIDGGNLVIKEGSWNILFLEQLGQFPSAAHDDYPDALATLYTQAFDRALVAFRAGYLRGGGAGSGRGVVPIPDEIWAEGVQTGAVPDSDSSSSSDRVVIEVVGGLA